MAVMQLCADNVAGQNVNEFKLILNVSPKQNLGNDFKSASCGFNFEIRLSDITRDYLSELRSTPSAKIEVTLSLTHMLQETKVCA